MKIKILKHKDDYRCALKIKGIGRLLFSEVELSIGNSVCVSNGDPYLHDSVAFVISGKKRVARFLKEFARVGGVL